MRLLLPLIFLSLNCIGQDTTFNIIGYQQTHAIVNSEGVVKSTREDSTSFKGAFIKAKKINQVLYIMTLDTLILIEEPTEIGPTDLSIKLWKFTNKAWATYHCCQTGLTDNIGDNSEVAKMVLTYPDKLMPEKKVKQRYWDHEERTVIIYILKKQATYSN